MEKGFRGLTAYKKAFTLAMEIYEFLRWVKAESSCASHGRDALNLVLAKENVKLSRHATTEEIINHCDGEQLP